jgi:hypothetical protein
MHTPTRLIYTFIMLFAATSYCTLADDAKVIKCGSEYTHTYAISSSITVATSMNGGVSTVNGANLMIAAIEAKAEELGLKKPTCDTASCTNRGGTGCEQSANAATFLLNASDKEYSLKEDARLAQSQGGKGGGKYTNHESYGGHTHTGTTTTPDGTAVGVFVVKPAEDADGNGTTGYTITYSCSSCFIKVSKGGYIILCYSDDPATLDHENGMCMITDPPSNQATGSFDTMDESTFEAMYNGELQ